MLGVFWIVSFPTTQPSDSLSSSSKQASRGSFQSSFSGCLQQIVLYDSVLFFLRYTCPFVTDTVCYGQSFPHWSILFWNFHSKLASPHIKMIALTFFLLYRCPKRVQEGHSGNPAHCAEDIQISFNFERVCLLWPTDCHLLLQSQAGLLQRQP